MNIIVVFTPFQAIAARFVIDSGVLSGEVRLFCFLKESDWARKLLGEQAEFLSGDTKLHGLQALRRFKKACAEIVASGNEITAVFAHPFHPAANYLMFSKWVSRRYILPDGIANYYHRSVDARLRRKMLLRKTAAMLVCLPYRVYSGHLVGHEVGLFDGAFTFQERGMVTSAGQIFPLKMKAGNPDATASPRSVMLMDQPIESILPKEVARNLRRRMWETIDSLDVDVIYYKGHYSQSHHAGEISGKTVVELDKDMPAELLLEQICPAYIVSFVSSGLIHAKLILPDINAISIGAGDIEKILGADVQGLTRMFELFEVKLM